MAKKSKEKDDLDFFYLGEEKNNDKNKKTRNKVSTSNKKKSKKDKEKQQNTNFDFDNEIIIGVKKIEDKPKKQHKKVTNNKKKNVKKKEAIKNNNKSSYKKGNTTKNVEGKKGNVDSKLLKEEIEINIKSPKKDLKKKPKPINDDGKAKKKRKKVFRTIKVLLLIGVILGGTIYFLLSPIFNITEINVSGNSKISSEEIISLSGIQKNENTFKINKKTVKDKIRENPYIDTISIKRTLPDSITIYVTERVATYRINKANTYMLINNQGYMLEITDEENNLPIITGLQTTDEEIQEGNRLRVEDLEKLEDVLKISESAKTNEIYGLITEIDISEKDNYRLVIPSEKKIIHLGDTSKLPVKMGYIISIMEKEKDEGEILVNTDLENEGAIFRKKV